MKKIPYTAKSDPAYSPPRSSKVYGPRDTSRDHLTLDHALEKIRAWGRDKKNGLHKSI